MRSNDVDRERLGLFGGTLAVLAVVTVDVSRLADVPVVALAPLYMFSPTIAALAVGLRTEVTFSALGVRLGRPRWLVAAAVVALPPVLATLGLSVAVPGVAFESGADPIPGLALPSGLLGVAAVGALVLGLGATVNAAFALGEELGWRGYLL